MADLNDLKEITVNDIDELTAALEKAKTTESTLTTLDENVNKHKQEKIEKTVKAKPLEARIHKNWLADYLRYTAFQESPPLFHKWIGIASIAAALNRSVYIQRGYNKLYPNLYTVLVSPTGKSKKTASANIGANIFLTKVDGVRILRDEATPKGLVQFLSLAPMSAVGTVHFQECTAFLYATELSDLLGEQSYNLGLIKKLTALWDCPDVYDDTTKELLLKNKEPTRLTNVCINMLGCSNPEWLAHGLKEDSFGGGFMGRTLFIYSIETNKTTASAWMDIPKDMEAMQLTLLRDLQLMSQLKGPFNVTEDAKALFVKMYKEYNGDFTGRMAGFLERKLTYVLKLAMILSVNESNTLIINTEHINIALEYLAEIEKEMPNAFVYINATNEARIAQHIVESIRESGGAEYRTRLVGKFRHLVRNIREFDDIVQMLLESHVLQIIWKDEQIIYVFSKVLDTTVKEQAEVEGIDPGVLRIKDDGTTEIALSIESETERLMGEILNTDNDKTEVVN